MLFSAIARSVLQNEGYRIKLKRALNLIGYTTTDWVRVVMYKRCFAFVQSLGPERLEVLEISAGPQWRRVFQFKSYTETQFPEVDICSETLDQQFDLIVADQVFEHLPFPYRAGKNVFSMLRPGGWFVIAVPFLVRVHRVPIDCSRWTEQGLSFFLQECGFTETRITTDSWGNRSCAKSNFKSWKQYGWYRSLKNESDYPVMVWAFAQKPPEPLEQS